MADTYSTGDTSLAAYLIASDIRLLDVNRTGSGMHFVFQDQNSCIELNTKFLLGNDLISAGGLLSGLRNIHRFTTCSETLSPQ